MSPLFVVALALLAWEITARRGLFGGFRLSLPRFGSAVVVGGALALVSSFAAQIALCDYQAMHDGVRSAWFGAWPLHLVDDAFRFGPRHAAFSFAALSLVVVQTLGLFIVTSGAMQAAPGGLMRIVPFFSAIALAGIALASPVVTSFDLLGYVGLGMLGAHPFDRPAGFFTGEYARVFAHYPLRETLYGPFWVAVNAAVVALGTTFAGKILALRIFGIVLVAVLVAQARALGVGRATLCALALNPMLWFQFVTNAHNDLLAIVLVVGALLALERKLLWVAIVLVAAAGAVKLPLLVLGVVVFARHRDRRVAIAAAAASVALAIAASAVFGGRAYGDALFAVVHFRAARIPSVEIAAFRVGVALFALGATAVALLTRRFAGFAAWLYPGLAPLLFPWYLAWTIPYVLVAGGGLLETLLALPLAATLADMIYRFGLIGPALALAAATFAAVAVWRARPKLSIAGSGG